MKWKKYIPLVLIALLIISSLSFLVKIFISKKVNPPSKPDKPVISQSPSVAKSVGELIPFSKRGLEGIKIYFQSYPTITPTTEWKENGIFWIEGEYVYLKGEDGPHLLKQNPMYYDFLRWPGNFSEPTGSKGGLLGIENRLRLSLSTDHKIKIVPEEYSIVKVKIKLKERVKDPPYSQWGGDVSEIETVCNLNTIKNGLVKVSEIQEALDMYVFEKYKSYLKSKAMLRHFDGSNPDIFQKLACEQHNCINGINLWFDKYWDPVNHRLLVNYDWSEDISNRKGCGYEYNVVRGVVSVNVQNQKVEAVYLDKSTEKMGCPIYKYK